jgi:hypothetical protein
MITDNVELIAKALESSEILKLSEDRTKISRIVPFNLRNQRDDWSLSVHIAGLPIEGSEGLIDLLHPVMSQFGKVQFITMMRDDDKVFFGEVMVEFADSRGAEASLVAPIVFQDVTLQTTKK